MPTSKNLFHIFTQRTYIGLVAVLFLSTSLFFGVQFFSSADGGAGGDGGGISSGMEGFGFANDAVAACGNAMAEAVAEAAAAVGSFGEGGGSGGGGGCPCGTICTLVDPKGGGCNSTACRACPASSPSAPVVSLNASPTSIEDGGSSTLTWDVNNGGPVDSCSANFGGAEFDDPITSEGSAEVSPSSNTTYFVECTGEGGTDRDEATVNVFAPIVATLTASPSLITNGESSTLTWSSSGDATSCSGSGFATGGATSGSTDVSPTENTTYVVLCEGPAGSDTDTDDVEVSNPSAPPEIDADPSRVEREDTTAISWDENGHLGCSITGTNGDSINVASSSPQTSDSIFGETTYTISCSDDDSSDSTTVTIIPEFEEF